MASWSVVLDGAEGAADAVELGEVLGAGDVHEESFAAAEVVADRSEGEAFASAGAGGGVVDALVGRPLRAALGEQPPGGLDQRLGGGGVRAALGQLGRVGCLRAGLPAARGFAFPSWPGR